MKRGITYLLYVFLTGSFITAQTIRFNKQYDFGYTNGSYVSTSVLKKNNGFLLCGYGLNTTQNQNYCIGIICTDSLGQQLWQNYSNAPNNFRYSSNSSASSFQQTKDGNVLFTGEIDYATSYSKSCLVKLSKYNGDTLWVKQYSQVGDTSNLFCTSQLTDSSFLSIGYKYFDNGSQFYNRPFILKTDKNGNYKWHKYLWNTTATLFPSFNKTRNLNDKDFIVAGAYSYTTPGIKGFLIKVDTLGNIAYNQTYTINAYSLNGFTDVIILNDGNFLLSGDVTTFHNANFSIERTRPTLIKVMGTNGTIINSKLYAAEKDNGHSIGDLYQDPLTLNIYSSGVEFFAPSTFKATFYKFNTLLDSLYMRYYDFGLGGTLGSTSSVRANDGGFAYAMQLYPSTAQQKFCLMKTDTMGCDSAGGCVIPIGLNEYTLNNNSFMIYPNPVKTELKIEAEFSSANEDLKVKLISALGLVIKEQQLSSESSIHSINMSDVSEGIYFLQMFNNDKIIAVKKVIKE